MLHKSRLIPTRFYSLLVLCFFQSILINLHGQNNKVIRPKNSYKITLLDVSYINYFTAKLGYEYRPESKNKGYEIELGYIFYSREEILDVNGYHFGASVNWYTKKRPHSNNSFKLMPFYNIYSVDQYLKYFNEIPNFGSFYEYRMTHYTKERFGLSTLFCAQKKATKNMFLEVNLGIGMMYIHSKVPPQVVQESFRNGLFDSNLNFNIISNVKLVFTN